MLTAPITVDVERSWAVHRWRVMGTEAECIVEHDARDLVRWAVDEAARLEAVWSRFRPDSELRRAEQSAGRPVPASADLLLAVERALELWACTDGAFDPTVRTALEAHGYDRTFADVPPADDRPLPPARPSPGPLGVVADRRTGCLVLPAGRTLDLGGVGKGLAADLLATGLVARGARSASVSLGGDVRLAGEPPDRGGWLVPVLDPFDARRVAFTARMAHGAIVTSTTTIRRWRRGGVDVHHLVDPRTGRPARTGVAAVVVAGPEAWRAEGLAKAALVAGPEAGRALLERHGARAWMWRSPTRVDVIGAPAAGVTGPTAGGPS